ncbi:putative ABC transport system permease protein [Desulforamulus hydrothermalis Lam5 = DSM 18033]|nr:iron export ABC transporter permease subunit FetB [Desulforamulus hydrothermalis]SHH23045.1 putative ABC transport system permease protein [Desulforamulus hydrothermalis Lam5 = DSM 18033]
MESTAIPISNLQLAFSVLLVLITGLISALLKLGLLKSLLWGTVRTFVQLTLVGYALTYIFKVNNLGLIIVIITLMCYVASRTAVKRTPNVPHYPSLLAFISLLASTYLVGTLVTVLIIAPDPWYSAKIVIPIFGMILGNSMNGIALSLDRLYAEARSRSAEIEAMLTFGATPWEAARSSVREALRAGMTPTINSLMVVGLVSLPGMMTGQILGGADPNEAVRYQIVVMLMITAAVAIGCLILVGLSYKKLFNEDGALQPFLRQSKK